MTQASWILLSGLGLATGLAGGALGAILVADSGPRTTSSTPQASNDESVAVLRDLVGEVRLLRQTMETVPAAPVSERAPVDGPSTDRLQRAIERLAEVLASPGSAVQPRRSAVPAQRNPIPPKATDRLLAICALSEAERGQTYYFWTRQEFVDRFGSPDEMNVQGDGGFNVVLQYQVAEDRWISLSFANDLLYYIDCSN